MSDVQFTAAQFAATDVARRHLDACVVAGPGSGKTTVLVEYFRCLVGAGRRPAAHPGHHLHRKGRRQHAQKTRRGLSGPLRRPRPPGARLGLHRSRLLRPAAARKRRVRRHRSRVPRRRRARILAPAAGHHRRRDGRGVRPAPARPSAPSFAASPRPISKRPCSPPTTPCAAPASASMISRRSPRRPAPGVDEIAATLPRAPPRNPPQPGVPPRSSSSRPPSNPARSASSPPPRRATR